MSEPSSRIRLAKDRHAIEAVAVGVDWAPHLETAALTAANAAHARVAELLPQQKSIKGMAFKIDAAKQAFQFGNANDLLDYLHLDDSGRPDFTVSIRPDFFSCSSTIYTKWQATKPLLLDRLLPFVDAALGEGAIMQAIGLQYTDVFRWSKTFGSLVREVFERDTRLLPPFTFDHGSFWHVHQGWFSSGHNSLRVLNTVNVDYVEEPEDLVLRINGQHKIQARHFDGRPAQIGMADMVYGLDGLHRANKDVLLSLLTREMLERIGMKGFKGQRS